MRTWKEQNVNAKQLHTWLREPGVLVEATARKGAAVPSVRVGRGRAPLPYGIVVAVDVARGLALVAHEADEVWVDVRACTFAKSEL